MRPHTSHVQQPLDVGIFHAYKCKYRNAVKSSALTDIVVDEEDSEATQARVKNIARGLLANMDCMKHNDIVRAFYHTGVFPVCRFTFIHFARGIFQVPEDVRQRARAVVEGLQLAKKQRVKAKGRINIVENALVVRAHL